MPKLKYKKKEKEKKKKNKEKKKKKSKRSHYSPPTIYEEQDESIPPLQATKSKEDQAWQQKLFEAMVDDQQDPFYTFYDEGQDYSNNDNNNNIHSMSDEAYRQHIQEGIYQKKYAKEIKEKEFLRKLKEEKEKEKEQAKLKLKQEQEKERQRYQQILELEKKQRHEKSYQHYCFLWEQFNQQDNNTTLTKKKDIPWPSVSHHSISFDNVKSFISHFMPTKKQLRQEQLKYHPDKFIPKLKSKFKGSDQDLDWIINKNNEVSSWLNQLWLEYQNKN